jgi:hypothetical protein
VTTDWNPLDAEATRVHYDLSDWTIDQQAELAAELAEAELPHAWDGSDLMVPPWCEGRADLLIEQVEERVGVVYGSGPAADEDSIPEGTATTEYGLDEWPGSDRELASSVLAGAGIAHRWEGSTLVVPTDREAEVEVLLDRIEEGDADEGERLPFETLTSFFLVGERLRRNPLDASGLEQLLAALEVADPLRPPFGVELRLWKRTCELAEELADALADDDEPDVENAATIAHDLHDLLRPFV